MNSGTTIFTGGPIFDGESLRHGMAVVVQDGWVTNLLEEASALGQEQALLDGQLLVPGFVDLQVNGGGGILFNDKPTTEAAAEIFSTHRRFGTTAMLPTLISDDLAVMKQAVTAIRNSVTLKQPGILGVHFEGPYINRSRRGAHPERVLRAPDLEALQLLTSGDCGAVMLTLAPECVPLEFIRALAAAGVIVCIGHSAADYETTRAALAAGARGFTHLFNAMTPMNSREPGVVGAALDDASSYCGIIVDGHHVHPATLRSAVAAKPRGRMCLVTDAMPCVGTPIENFRLGGHPISVSEGRCTTPEGTLAGSNLDMAQALRNCVQMLGLSLEESLRMASLYPAEFLRDETRGRIAPGFRADFCVLDEKLCVSRTFVAGRSN